MTHGCLALQTKPSLQGRTYPPFLSPKLTTAAKTHRRHQGPGAQRLRVPTPMHVALHSGVKVKRTDQVLPKSLVPRLPPQHTPRKPFPPAVLAIPNTLH